MLVFSQVLLSMQLAFAVIPLIHFVSDKEKMGQFKIGLKVQIAAWIVAAVIVGLNVSLLYSQAKDVLLHVRNGWADAGMIAASVLMVSLLGVTFFLSVAETQAGGSGQHRYPSAANRGRTRTWQGFPARLPWHSTIAAKTLR